MVVMLAVLHEVIHCVSEVWKEPLTAHEPHLLYLTAYTYYIVYPLVLHTYIAH